MTEFSHRGPHGPRAQATMVRAAQDGDQQGLDALVADYLPLIHNIVGRALDAPADTDDVVQEIMRQMIRGPSKLRDPEALRSWLVAIAMREVRRHWRVRRSTPATVGIEGIEETAAESATDWSSPSGHGAYLDVLHDVFAAHPRCRCIAALPDHQNVRNRRTVLLQHRDISVNGITMHIAEQGEGPLILLLHGFPESWYSWRHQFQSLAEAGYRVVAPDQRGYGATDRPTQIDQYTIMHLVGDVVGLIGALGEKQAVVVGHDWGAMVAWSTALLRPDVVRGVVGVSVPPLPRGPVPPLVVTRERFGEGFYQNYFQQPGVADAELAKDIDLTFRRTLAGVPAVQPSTGDGEPGSFAAMAAPDTLPDWISEHELTMFVEQFTASGFTGPINWYRNLDRNWELTAAWQDAPITPPSLYISGERDIVRTFYALDDAARAIVPNLRGVVDVPDCGHWTQQERPAVVNAALLDFVRTL